MFRIKETMVTWYFFSKLSLIIFLASLDIQIHVFRCSTTKLWMYKHIFLDVQKKNHGCTISNIDILMDVRGKNHYGCAN